LVYFPSGERTRPNPALHQTAVRVFLMRPQVNARR
jgi:hypothetical protein